MIETKLLYVEDFALVHIVLSFDIGMFVFVVVLLDLLDLARGRDTFNSNCPRPLFVHVTTHLVSL